MDEIVLYGNLLRIPRLNNNVSVQVINRPTSLSLWYTFHPCAKIYLYFVSESELLQQPWCNTFIHNSSYYNCSTYVIRVCLRTVVHLLLKCWPQGIRLSRLALNKYFAIAESDKFSRLYSEYSGVQHILCCVFVLFVFVLCTLSC
jgi:hypothetical protein